MAYVVIYFIIVHSWYEEDQDTPSDGSILVNHGMPSKTTPEFMVIPDMRWAPRHFRV